MSEARGWSELKTVPGLDIEASIYVRVDNGTVDEADVQSKLAACVQSVFNDSVSVQPSEPQQEAVDDTGPAALESGEASSGSTQTDSSD